MDEELKSLHDSVRNITLAIVVRQQEIEKLKNRMKLMTGRDLFRAKVLLNDRRERLSALKKYLRECKQKIKNYGKK